MGWQQKVDKCHDRLVVRVGGPNGPMIRWGDRGLGGAYTWAWNDPVGEVRDISPWVGDGDQIKLYALIIETGETGDHQCDMDTLYNGQRKQRWEFDEDEDHDIRR